MLETDALDAGLVMLVCDVVGAICMLVMFGSDGLTLMYGLPVSSTEILGVDMLSNMVLSKVIVLFMSNPEAKPDADRLSGEPRRGDTEALLGGLGMVNSTPLIPDGPACECECEVMGLLICVTTAVCPDICILDVVVVVDAVSSGMHAGTCASVETGMLTKSGSLRTLKQKKKYH